MDEKIAVQDAGDDLRQIAATLLETEEAVGSRLGAKAEQVASDVGAQAKGALADLKVLPGPALYGWMGQGGGFTGQAVQPLHWVRVAC